MMTSDMSTPVTRGELREELAQLDNKFTQLDNKFTQLDNKFAQLDNKFAQLDNKFTQLDNKLEIWGGALVARIQSNEQRIDCVAQQIQSSEQRILAELARHAKAIQESVSTQITAVDEKYKDLPARVSRLESAGNGRRATGHRRKRR